MSNVGIVDGRAVPNRELDTDFRLQKAQGLDKY